MPRAPSTLSQLPRGIWVLGFVSLLMDVSSEMIHSLLPVFMVTVLGTGVWAVGLVEGLAEATALMVKVASGALSDRWGRRKPLALAGYALGAASKPLFALAPGLGLLVVARFADRVGKGLRGAPRDALVADLAPAGLRGAAFGLRQALDTVGAFAGPLLATALMLLWANDFRAVFWVACVPALLCVLLLWLGVQEPERPASAAPLPANPLQRVHLRRLGVAFWAVVGWGALFNLARFSEAFLLLRAEHLGLALAWVPLVLVAMNGVYAAAAYPLGWLADRVPHRSLLAGGLGLLVAADVLLALAPSWPWVGAGVVLWGLHLAMTQGLLAAMVAGAAPADLRGTAFGCFNLASGVALLVASFGAGLLWDGFGAAAPFWAGAAVAALALLLLMLHRVPQPPAQGAL